MYIFHASMQQHTIANFHAFPIIVITDSGIQHALFISINNQWQSQCRTSQATNIDGKPVALSTSNTSTTNMMLS